MPGAVQGLFSGPMVPLSQTILMRAFPPAKRTLALALWGMTVLLAPDLSGRWWGGWLIDNFSWPWIFLINLPDRAVLVRGVHADAAAAGLARRGEPDRRAGDRAAGDRRGLAAGDAGPGA
ncbi:major Facilitator Superfamily protein [Burkholderia pseudomallei MSHR3964]|nr:major Facilitator Superfamily protein [Burkholderia pseudomallei MSHR3964]